MIEPTNKKHTVVTISDLIDLVTLDNCEDLGRDIAQWLKVAASVKDTILKMGGTLERDLTSRSFEWTDNDQNGVNVSVYLIIPTTDETTRA